jgi:hypothetical protein
LSGKHWAEWFKPDIQLEKRGIDGQGFNEAGGFKRSGDFPNIQRKQLLIVLSEFGQA